LKKVAIFFFQPITKNMAITSAFRSFGTLFSMIFFGAFMACTSPQNDTNKTLEERFPFEEFTIEQLHEGYLEGAFGVRDVVQAYHQRIEAIDQNGPALHAIIQLNPDALAIADQMDQALLAGDQKGALFGVPVLLKDNIDTHDGMNTTAGSRALKDSYPLKDSYVAQKLREAGAIIIGKANLSEWANFRGELSSSGWSGLGGQTKNPYVLDRNPCGSSSGSAVAVSANLCMLAVGTETNGSIVCPSHINGIVGIKPTVGLVSRSGVIPISFTQDTPGPMARNVHDAAIMLGAMTGVDSADRKTLASEGHFYTDYTRFLHRDGLKGKRLGLFRPAFGQHYKVDEIMLKTVDYLRAQGAEVVDVEQVITAEVEAASFEIMLYEYKDGLNNYFASLGENAPVKNVEELIAFNKTDSVELKFFNQKYLEMALEKGDLNSPDYLKALAIVEKGSREMGIDRVMDELQLDAIIAPTGSPAWKTDHLNGDHYQLGTSSEAAISGYPNITVPMGFVDDLPVGISFYGRAWSEPKLIEIAYAFEQAANQRKAPQFLTTD